jgi:hypothetical protein
VVDIWCVQQPYYNLSAGNSLRSEGKQLWWYNTAFPAYPYANWLIEYQAMEARLLMGAMAYKFKTDGHLYWAVDKYANNTSPLSSSTGPYTAWDPRSIQHSSGKWVDGDGCLVLPAVDGPIPTLRLENIRDGLEDICKCRMCEGIKDIRKGLCKIEEGLCDIVKGVKDTDFDHNCAAKKAILDGICDIKEGICDIRKGLTPTSAAGFHGLYGYQGIPQAPGHDHPDGRGDRAQGRRAAGRPDEREQWRDELSIRQALWRAAGRP